MKNILLSTLVIFSYLTSNCQITKLSIKDGPFLNSIDWFIDSTTRYINNLPIEYKIKCLAEMGVVSIDFFNNTDSIEERKSTDLSESIEVIRHSRNQFIIYIQGKSSVTYTPPSYYFIHKGVCVTIYTGLERFIKYEEKSIKSLQAIVSKAEELKLINSLKTYFIKIDERYKDGFLAVELKR